MQKISRDTLNLGLVFAGALIFITLIGIPAVFDKTEVVFLSAESAFTLYHVLFISILFGAGYAAVYKQEDLDTPTLSIRGATASGLAGLALAFFLVLAYQIDLRNIFPNVSPELLNVLTFGQEEILGIFILLISSAILGALGALVTRLPSHVQSLGFITVFIPLLVGLLQTSINDLINIADALAVAFWVSVGYLAAGRYGSELLGRIDALADNGSIWRATLRSMAAGLAAGLLVALLLAIVPTGEDTLLETSLLGGFWANQSTLAGLVGLIIAGAVGAFVGAMMSFSPAAVHNLALSLIALLLILGVVQADGEVSIISAVIIGMLVLGLQLVGKNTSRAADIRHEKLDAPRQRRVRLLNALVGVALLLIVPQISNLYITSVLDQVGLYVLMGLGLNIVVGYAGLLDLGYVAFFAIGAYATGIMTTPNLVTCPPPGDNIVVVNQAGAEAGFLKDDYRALGRESVAVVEGTPSVYTVNVIRRTTVVPFASLDDAVAALEAGEVAAVVGRQANLAPHVEAGKLVTGAPFRPDRTTWKPSDLTKAEHAAWCGSILPFWAAWPVAGIIAGFAGVLLGIPVLRMRGDYLAIVTLGFGEIIRIVTLSDTFADYLGGAQGVTEIPSPVIDLTVLSGVSETFNQPIVLSNASEVYYLILGSVLLVGFVAIRLSNSRLGRAWMAMREDEDVAEAMGINLVNAKLLAFSIGAAFAGIGGAIFGSWLHSIFPNSFTLLVSINVLSLIIIGGMGSIPGVVVGAFALIGLPEVLREFSDYRMLAFGALLVVMMLLRPEGLLPAKPRKLELAGYQEEEEQKETRAPKVPEAATQTNTPEGGK